MAPIPSSMDVATEDEVLAALRELSAAAEEPLKALAILRHHRALYKGALRYFDSFAAANLAAGIQQPARTPYRWTTDSVVEGLREARRAGVRLTYEELSKAGRRDLVDAAQRLFGGIRNAREAAGFEDPKTVYQPYQARSCDRIVEQIRSLHREGASLATTQVEARLVRASRRLFGSWEDAVTSAGLDYATVRLSRPAYSEVELLEGLRMVAEHHPEMTVTELRRHRLGAPAHERFGSLEAASGKAGLTDWPRRRSVPLLSREETLDGLRARRALDLPLGARAVRRDNDRLARAVYRHFDHWSEALAAADLEPDAAT